MMVPAFDPVNTFTVGPWSNGVFAKASPASRLRRCRQQIAWLGANERAGKIHWRGREITEDNESVSR